MIMFKINLYLEEIHILTYFWIKYDLQYLL